MKILLTACALLFSATVSANTLHSIVVFGDSLSDNGNLYDFMDKKIPSSPPYYNGRFTNGPVWVERLASSYFAGNGSEHLLDYAFGGAGIAMEENDDDDDVLFTLSHEIDTYLLAHDNKADSHSLFVVWIGANNYLGVPDDVDESVRIVNKGIKKGLERLVKKGARHIMVLNIPNLGKTPAARDFDAVDKLTELTQRHNAVLAESITRLQDTWPAVEWFYVDTDSSVNAVMSAPEKYGFHNVTDTCYNLVMDKPSQRSVITMASHPLKRKSSDACEGYLFFDPVHSTAPAHQLVADLVRQQLDAAGVSFSK